MKASTRSHGGGTGRVSTTTPGRCLIALLVLCLARAAVADTSYDYGLMIDAGSTGSRIHIFKWTARTYTVLPPTLSEPIAQHDGSKRLAPGISTGPLGLAVLKQLISFAKTSLATVGESGDSLGQIPIFLKATAGMRVLPLSERESIMTKVRGYLATTGFMFKPDWARIISGEEEGVFGWLTVNYQYGRLVDSHKPTLGALDLGGASTQITFQPGVDILSNLFNVQLGSVVNEDVYTHSFLYFGQNEAMRRVSQLVVDTTKPIAPSSDWYANPCFNAGFSMAFTTLNNRVVSINGTGDHAKCRALAADLMDKGTVCLTDSLGNLTAQPSSCSINGVYQPPVGTNEFIAFSGFTHVYSFLGLAGNSSLGELKAASTASCATDWSSLQAKYPHIPATYLRTYCFTSSFTGALLGDGYGFSDDTHFITVAGEDSSISYALGSMIFEANALSWRYQGPKTSNEPFLALFVVFAVLALVGWSSLVYMACCRKPQTIRRQQTLSLKVPLNSGV